MGVAVPGEFRGTPLDWCPQCKTYHYRDAGCPCTLELTRLKAAVAERDDLIQLQRDRIAQLQQTAADLTTQLETVHMAAGGRTE